MHYNNSSIFALYHALVLRCQSTLQTNNSKQLGIEALHRWRAGPREEAICPRSPLNQRPSWKQYSWMLAPRVRTQHHQPTPTHMHWNKNQAGRQQQGRAVTWLPKPRVSTLTICCTDWKLGVQVSFLYRQLWLKPGETVTNEITESVHIWGSSAFHPQPSLGVSVRFLPRVGLLRGLGGSQESYTLPTWTFPGPAPSRTWFMCSK